MLSFTWTRHVSEKFKVQTLAATGKPLFHVVILPVMHGHSVNQTVMDSIILQESMMNLCQAKAILIVVQHNNSSNIIIAHAHKKTLLEKTEYMRMQVHLPTKFSRSQANILR